ncbi:hypothetical protein CN996_25020 [Bacillus cereus]|nr:hypothetical protein CN996_25020 [Bacillus cereus]
MSEYTSIAKKLLKTFFYNKDVYAKQLKDENDKVMYNTVYNKIDANKIRFMLQNEQAIMTYQQKFERLKWLCLDFDINRSVISEGYDFFNDDKYRELLNKEVQRTVAVLRELKISYALEFSGNRGFHIWIFLKQEINKYIGNLLLEGLIEKVKFEVISKPNTPITLDKYPKNGQPKGNRIGLGVKIPLSYHLKSNSYSHLIEDITDVKRVTKMTDDFLQKQGLILDRIESVDISYLLEVLEIDKIEDIKQYEAISGSFVNDIELDEVIRMLSKCEIYNYIFSKSLSDLTEFDRMVITGTLIRLSSSDNNKLGRDLLSQYFSSDSEVYNHTITNEKLKVLGHLYPPTIAYLEKKYHLQCNHCRQHDIKNVMQLLEGVEVNYNSNTKRLLKWVINSEKKYLTQNDEVPLNFIYDELSNINIGELEKDIIKIKQGEFSKAEYFKYIRKEGEDKNRELISLSAKDRVLTTYAMFELNQVLYGQYSTNSYSYRLNYDLNKNDIFINWNTLWLKYVKNIEDKIYSDSYDNYYILKLDVHKFYEKVNHIMLREILYEAPSEVMSLMIKDLTSEQKETYKNLCEYLINVSMELSMEGVPQGPAYARYLAEIYLTVVDEAISKELNKDYEHYFRYVDDMVIIVENEETANRIYNIVESVLGTLSLDLNMDKILKGKVSDLKHQIIGQDINKYFIDGIDETTPKRVLNKAVAVLDRMFKDELDNVNIKQLPFYLTHLINKDYLEAKREEIIHTITESEIGRGSLFKHFYKNIIFAAPRQKDVEFYRKLKGLSRANFINELSRDYLKLEIEQLKEIICYYIKVEDLQNYERIELLRVVLKSGLQMDGDFIKKNDYSIIIRLLESTTNINWTEELLKGSLVVLQGIEDKSRVLNHLNCILSNSINIPAFKEVIETIYSTISRHKKVLYTIENNQIVYNLIAFITMFLRLKQIEDLWRQYHLSFHQSNIKINYNAWYKYDKVINKKEIVDESVLFFLTSVFSGQGVIQELGVKDAEEEYAMYLFLYLFNSEEKPTLKEEIQDRVKQIANKQNLKFLQWCLDGNINYYPDDDIAISNIYLNNRIIIKRNNTLLIRGSEKILDDFDEKQRQIENWYDQKEYHYAIIELKEKLQNLDDKFSELELFDALGFLVKIQKLANVEEDKYLNVFEKGTFREGDEEFYFRYSKYDNKIVINKDKKINNNKKAFFSELLNNFTNADIKNKIFLNSYECSNKTFIQDFVPTYLKDIETVMEFIKMLSENIRKYFKINGENLYSLELSKIVAIKELIQKREMKRYDKEIECLNYYNSLYGNDYEKFILYSSKSKIDTNNLKGLIEGIVQSVSTNIEHDDVLFIQKYLNKISSYVEEEVSITDLAKFKKVRVDKNYINNTQLKIAEGLYDIASIKYYEIGNNEEFKQLTNKEVFYLLNSDYVYWYNDYIILIPSALEKILEIVEQKEGRYDKSSLEIESGLVNDPNFDRAVQNIQLQSGVTLDEAKMRISEFCQGIDHKYFSSILKVISSYLVFKEEDIQYFIDLILNKVKQGEEKCLMPLKKKNDDNGLHQILFVKYKTLFDRKSDNEKRILNDFRKIDRKQPINEIVLISDIGLGGSQFKKALNYYMNDSLKGKKSHSYLDVNKKAFKELFFNPSVSLTLLNCLYTDKYKREVIAYLDEKGFKGKVNFEGTAFNYQKYLYKNIVNKKRDRDVFVEFAKENFDTHKLSIPVPGKLTYNDYLKKIENDSTQNVLVARYRSMPKYHHVIFTERTSIFQYRKD